MVLGKWSGLQGRWSDPHLGLTNMALLLQMIYNPTNRSPLQTSGSGCQQGPQPPVSHPFPKGWAAPIGAMRAGACRKWEALLVLLVGLPDRPWRDFHWRKGFTPYNDQQSGFPGNCAAGHWAFCSTVGAWPGQHRHGRRESKQVLGVSARTIALHLLTFLTICSKIEAFNIRAKQ